MCVPRLSSLLCDCEIVMIVFNLHDKPIQYSSRDMDQSLFKFCDMTDQRKPQECYTNTDMRNSRTSGTPVVPCCAHTR